MWDFNFNTPDRTPPRQQEDKFMNILPSLLNHPETFMAASGEYTIDCDSYFQEDLPFFFFNFCIHFGKKVGLAIIIIPLSLLESVNFRDQS